MSAPQAEQPHEIPAEIKQALDAALANLQPIVAPILKQINNDLSELEAEAGKLQAERDDLDKRTAALSARRENAKRQLELLKAQVTTSVLAHVKETLADQRRAVVASGAHPLWFGIKETLARANRPLSVREIYNDLRARGWPLSDHTGLQIVRNTLARKRQLFGRCAGGTFTLVERMTSADEDVYAGSFSASGEEGGAPIAARSNRDS